MTELTLWFKDIAFNIVRQHHYFDFQLFLVKDECVKMDLRLCAASVHSWQPLEDRPMSLHPFTPASSPLFLWRATQTFPLKDKRLHNENLHVGEYTALAP